MVLDSDKRQKHEALTATLSLHLSHMNTLHQRLLYENMTAAIIPAEEEGLLASH